MEQLLLGVTQQVRARTELKNPCLLSPSILFHKHHSEGEKKQNSTRGKIVQASCIVFLIMLKLISHLSLKGYFGFQSAHTQFCSGVFNIQNVLLISQMFIEHLVYVTPVESSGHLAVGKIIIICTLSMLSQSLHSKSEKQFNKHMVDAMKEM